MAHTVSADKLAVNCFPPSILAYIQAGKPVVIGQEAFDKELVMLKVMGIKEDGDELIINLALSWKFRIGTTKLVKGNVKNIANQPPVVSYGGISATVRFHKSYFSEETLKVIYSEDEEGTINFFRAEAQKKKDDKDYRSSSLKFPWINVRGELKFWVSNGEKQGKMSELVFDTKSPWSGNGFKKAEVFNADAFKGDTTPVIDLSDDIEADAAIIPVAPSQGKNKLTEDISAPTGKR